MTIVLSIVGLILISLIIGKVNLLNQFNKEVKKLFSLAKIISDQTFHINQTLNLPAPVQRNFNYILKDGQPYISYARIKHDGQFKTGKPTAFEVLWRLDKGDFSYAKFNITEVEYNKPEKF